MWKFITVALALSLALVSSESRIDSDFFPYAQGWMGGDAAYSIPLDSRTTVWLFGDTFIGRRRPETMIHNAVAVRTCQPTCTTSYWWHGKGTGKADAFFATNETNYFWPLDGFLQTGQLHVFLEAMHTTGDGGPMGFDYSGVTLASVANPHDRPSSWHVSYRGITKGNRIIPGIAAVDQGPYAYVFTLIKQTGQDVFLALFRLPQQELSTESKEWTWQYLAEDGKWLSWQEASVPAHAKRLLNGNITEMSVKFHPDSGRWVAVFPTPGFLSSTASFSTSKSLQGPWTPPRAFFHFPEMMGTDSRYTPKVFCYAAKEHVELEQPGSMVFSYACNSMEEPQIFRDLRLYRPQLVTMKFPES